MKSYIGYVVLGMNYVVVPGTFAAFSFIMCCVFIFVEAAQLTKGVENPRSIKTQQMPRAVSRADTILLAGSL